MSSPSLKWRQSDEWYIESDKGGYRVTRYIQEFKARGGVVQVLPAFGNMFTDNSRVTYGS